MADRFHAAPVLPQKPMLGLAALAASKRFGVRMTPRSSAALGQQLLVFVPTAIVSWLLGRLGVPLPQRIAAALGFGAVLIAGMAYVRRKNQV